MARASVFQGNFLGGEWSPNAQGRIDLPAQRTALQTCSNSYPTEEGAWQKRDPFFSLGMAYKGYTHSVVQLSLPTGAAIYLEETYHSSAVYFRFWTDLSASGLGQPGIPVLLPDSVATITAISTANPVEITLSAAVTWSTGDLIQVFPTTADSASNAAQLQGRQCLVTKVDTTHFTLTDAVSGHDIDGSLYSFSSSGGTSYACHIPVTTTDYTSQNDLTGSASLTGVSLLATGSVVYLLSPNYAPKKLTYGAAFTSDTIKIPCTVTYADAAFISTSDNFFDGPYNDPLSGSSQLGYDIGTLSAAGTATPTLTSASYTFVADDVGRQIRIWSQPAAFDVSTNYALGAYVTYGGQFWQMTVSEPGAGVVPGQGVTVSSVLTYPWVLTPQAGAWAYGTITSVSSGVATLKLSGGIQPPTGNGTSIDEWVLGTYTTNGAVYPTCGTFHAGRVVLGGAAPGRVDLSEADGTLFSPTDFYGNVLDSGGISETLNTPPQASMNWMVSDPTGIICGTNIDEWLIAAGSDGILSPTSIDSKRISRYGSVRIDPLRIGIALIFVQTEQRTLMEYVTDPFSARFVGYRLNTLAKHLTQGGAKIIGIAYQEEPTPIIWCALQYPTPSGSPMIGCTYRRSKTFGSDPADFYGWHRHSYGLIPDDPALGAVNSVSGNALAIQDPAGNNPVMIMPPSGGQTPPFGGLDGSSPNTMGGVEVIVSSDSIEIHAGFAKQMASPGGSFSASGNLEHDYLGSSAVTYDGSSLSFTSMTITNAGPVLVEAIDASAYLNSGSGSNKITVSASFNVNGSAIYTTPDLVGDQSNNYSSGDTYLPSFGWTASAGDVVTCTGTMTIIGTSSGNFGFDFRLYQ